MKNWKRTLTIGLIWGYILFGWYLNNFFKTNWNFHIFSLSNWEFIVDEFRKGWGISSTGDWVFVSIILFMFPFYIFTWRCALNVKWTDLIQRTVNKIIFFFTGSKTVLNRPVKLDLNKNSSKTTRPKALDSGLIRPIAKDTELKVPVDEMGEAPKQNSYSGMGRMSTSTQNSGFSFDNSKNGFMPPNDSPFTSSYGTPSAKKSFSIAPSPLDEDDFDKILLEDIKLPERTRLEEDLEAVLEKAGYSLLRNVQLGNLTADYLAVGENRVIVCQIDPEEGDWLADEERFNGEDPLWFSESSHRISPVFKLLEEVKKLSTRLSTSGFIGSVAPVFVIKKGTIINAEDMLSTWKEMSISVCRTDMGGPDDLKSFTETIVQDKEPSEETLAIVHNAL
ncbi:MAG: hypothetical protein IJY92_04220 [Alphaproteobacteria bacterium]|nr:hypothetical protein [Alphaproteobacteria bacterium]